MNDDKKFGRWRKYYAREPWRLRGLERKAQRDIDNLRDLEADMGEVADGDAVAAGNRVRARGARYMRRNRSSAFEALKRRRLDPLSPAEELAADIAVRDALLSNQNPFSLSKRKMQNRQDKVARDIKREKVEEAYEDAVHRRGDDGGHGAYSDEELDMGEEPESE